MAARVCLLGPPRVEVAGEAVDLGGANPRLVLAVLAVSFGEVVAADTLAEEIWGPRPRVDVTGALQRLVSRLRRAVSPAGLTVTASGPGYLLAGDVEVDARRFEELAGRGRELARRIERDEAAAAFRAALDLWRGPALAGYAERPFARVEAARLEEGRAAVVEGLGGALLEAGRAAEAVAALEPLVAAEPYRENAWAVLMLALYRTGRQADALEAYRRYRQQLARELGLEPGPDLRRLESAILTHSADLNALTHPRRGLAADAETQRQRQHNLPAATARFLGRTAELADLAALLRRDRLVTLWGPGGVGKTRLSIEAAARALPEFADGAWLAELAPVRRDEDVAPAVMAALGMLGPPPRDGATDTLCRHLRHRQALVVLDNCEHVLAGAADLARELLARCAEVRVLATSREPLGVPGESVWPARSLALRDAVALFCDRAARAHAGFGLTDANAPAVREICRRLEGMPLALELAAARVRVLGVQGLAGRLGDGLHAVVGGAPAGDPRHRTLASAVEWSYGLLPPAERRMLEALSVFPGTFDLEAASAVGADGTGAAVGFGGLELLARLVDKSLVETVEDSGGVRYRILETIRQYAADRLDAADGTRAARRRHLDHFLATPVGDPLGHFVDEEPLFRAAHRDQHNYRAALEWALTEPDGEAAARLCGGLHSYWIWAEPPTVTPRAWAARALQLLGQGPSLDGAMLRSVLGWFDRDAGLAEEAIRMAAQLGDPVAHAAMLMTTAVVVAERDPRRADGNLRRALAMLPPGTRGVVPSWCHLLLAWNALAAGDAAGGATQAEQALALSSHATLSDTNFHATLAFAVALRGEADRAGELAERALAIARQAPFPGMTAMALVRGAAAASFCARWARAEAYVRELLALLRDLNTRRWVGDGLDLAGVVLEATGRPGAPGVLCTAARYRRSCGEPPGGGLAPLAELVERSRRRLGLPDADATSATACDRDDALRTAAAAFDG